MKKAVGIDLGGTFIKGAIIDEEGHIVVKNEIPTEVEKGPEDILKRIEVLVHSLARGASVALSDLAGVGIGIPGFLDDATGMAVEVVNLGWKDVSVRDPLKERLGLPIYLENDANSAALGEAWVGAGRGRDSAICITLGTGVGGGIVLGARVLRGANVMAGEIGHMVMDPDGARCNCGRHGCLETVSSATGIVRLAKERLARGETSSLNANQLTPADVFAAAAQGDIVATEVLSYAIDTLGRGLAIAAVLINPEVIVVGGGMSRAGNALFKPLNASFKHYALPRVAEVADIVPATLGNDAGVVGAGKLALYS